MIIWFSFHVKENITEIYLKEIRYSGPKYAITYTYSSLSISILFCGTRSFQIDKGVCTLQPGKVYA